MQPVKFEDLVEQALRLSPDARADLVRRLAASLPDPALDALDDVWCEEAAARAQDWDRDPAAGRDLEQAVQALLSSLR